MRMSRCFVAAAFLLFHFVSSAFAAGKVVKSKYKVGQVWSYKTRPSERSSTFVVLKTENDGKYNDRDNIIHIAVRGIKSKNHGSGTIVDLPIYERALNRSFPRLLQSNAKLPPFQKEYRAWRTPRDKGVGGAVYTAPLAECIALQDR